MSSFFWVRSMVRDVVRRTMLFEFDRTRQSLRAKHGDGPETMAMPGHHHNLSRMWAEL